MQKQNNINKKISKDFSVYFKEVRVEKMRDAEIIVLDENDEEYVRLLENFGMSKSMAKIIICLALHQECTSRQIEIITGIKSSTVSIILKKLREDKIIAGAKKAGKDDEREVMHYKLSGSMDHILGILSERKRKETSQYIEKIKKIKSKLK